MACPTCDHTMQSLDSEWFWCPRCGTIKPRNGHPEAKAPMLVSRCRIFEPALDEFQKDEWRKIGIAEAINPPEER